MMKKIGLYIHIPFCERKCNYCDFLSSPADETTKDLYMRQLLEEIKVQSGFYSEYTVASIYIGGGTPSSIKAVYITNIMSAVYACWKVEAQAEISMECNPGTLTSEKLLNYRAAGINRISLGLQSTVDAELEILGRIHTYDDFLMSYEYVREAGFKNVNVDLISAVPGQSVGSWKNTLKQVAALKPEHISAYSLIIEEGTPFYDVYGNDEGKKLLPCEDDDREMYHSTGEILNRYNYKRYEISNYSKPGYECRHNIGYWTGAEYLGLGIGAASFVMNRRFHVEKDIKKYLQIDFNRDINPLYQELEELTEQDRMSEFMFLGLRMTEGVSGAEFAERFNRNMMDVYAVPIDHNVRRGLIEVDGSIIRLTEKGLDLANTVMCDFI